MRKREKVNSCVKVCNIKLGNTSANINYFQYSSDPAVRSKKPKRTVRKN